MRSRVAGWAHSRPGRLARSPRDGEAHDPASAEASAPPPALPPALRAFARRVWRRMSDLVRSPAYPWLSAVVLAVVALRFNGGDDSLFPSGRRWVFECDAMMFGARCEDTWPRRYGELPALIMSVASVLPLMWRRRHPGAASVLAVLAGLGTLLVWPDAMATAAVCLWLGGYTLARHRVAHPLVLVGAGLVAVLLVNTLHNQWGLYLSWEAHDLSEYSYEALPLGGGLLVAVLLGLVAHDRAAQARRERAAAQARQVAAARFSAAAGERADIARELHDIVSHSVSVIAVRAESATYTTPELSPQAREGFQEIAKFSREALSELRQLLNVLRSDGDGLATDAPQPSLANLEELLDRHRSTGGSAELRVHGSLTDLPASAELCGYRIVQEALTNARRHAPGAHAVVEVSHGYDRLTLQVTDDGPGAPEQQRVEEGHGLIGMRERVTMLGGRFFAGPGMGGGFLVRAELPTPPPSGDAAEEGETP